MDSIQTALFTFKKLKNYQYNFTIAYNKTLHYLKLSFDDKDFRHIIGLHYLNDIDIPRTPNQLFSKIENNKINDDYLGKSNFYLYVENNDVIVKNHIYYFRFIEEFLDSPNLVFKYVKYLNKNSMINADYMITSTFNHIRAHIFMKQRRNTENIYCICSFFIPQHFSYTGQKAYWYYKSKIYLPSGEEQILINKGQNGYYDSHRGIKNNLCCSKIGHPVPDVLLHS